MYSYENFLSYILKDKHISSILRKKHDKNDAEITKQGVWYQINFMRM